MHNQWVPRDTLSLTRYSNCILHMSCGSHWFLHTNHMAAWHYDNFKSCTSREVNTRCSHSRAGVGNVSGADGGGFFIFSGSGCDLSLRYGGRDISSINMVVGLWMSWSAWQTAGKMPGYCTGLSLFMAGWLFVLRQHRCGATVQNEK